MTNVELKSEGLRLASANEAGWFYKTVIDGEIETLWVTDDVEYEPSAINWTQEEPRPFIEKIMPIPLIKFGGVHPRHILDEYTSVGVECRHGLYRASQVWEIYEDLTDLDAILTRIEGNKIFDTKDDFDLFT